jgi:hypothetical protein
MQHSLWRLALNARLADLRDYFGPLGGGTPHLDTAEFQRYWQAEIRQSRNTVFKVGRMM